MTIQKEESKMSEKLLLQYNNQYELFQAVIGEGVRTVMVDPTKLPEPTKVSKRTVSWVVDNVMIIGIQSDDNYCIVELIHEGGSKAGQIQQTWEIPFDSQLFKALIVSDVETCDAA